MSPPLRDARGCLTEAGFRAIESAPVGEGPKELAAHLAGCNRCQERLLLGAHGPGGPTPRKPAGRPPLWRPLLVIFGGLLVAMLAMLTLRWMTR